MIEIILYCPEIPQNTGNIGRLCAFADLGLHLIHPLGFEINDKNLRRAGMDYWRSLKLFEYRNWDNFLESKDRPKRIHLLTTHGKNSLWDNQFKRGDGLIFGNEGKGAPSFIHRWVGERKILIPKNNPELRSLNLAVSVGIAAYEALRQIKSGN